MAMTTAAANEAGAGAGPGGTEGKIFFVSDLHFGADYGKAHPDREGHFVRFLETRVPGASHLFILGDLFEFWMEYRNYVPKKHFRVLAALARLVEQGVEVHYLSGNHDFNLGSFFGDSLGLKVHQGPVPVELQGKRVLLLHGDGLASSDWKYRLVKKIMLHPWSNGAFRLLHPDFGMELAKGLSKLSRDRHGNRPRFLEQYEKASRKLLAQGHDVVMHGHSHAGFVKRLPEGVYVNSGEWLERMEFVVMRGGVCSLETYRP
jgi:UDP-2,3-diacylglucosamine hydrolase